MRAGIRKSDEIGGFRDKRVRDKRVRLYLTMDHMITNSVNEIREK